MNKKCDVNNAKMNTNHQPPKNSNLRGRGKIKNLASVSANMASRERNLARSQRERQGVRTPSISSPDPDYNSGLSQVLIEPNMPFEVPALG